MSAHRFRTADDDGPDENITEPLRLAPPPPAEVPEDVGAALGYLWAQVILLWERPVQRAEAAGTLPRRVGRARVAAVCAEAADLITAPALPWEPRAETADGPYASGGSAISWEPEDDPGG